MGYKSDQRLPSEVHEETLKAAREEQGAFDPPPPYSEPAGSTSNFPGSSSSHARQTPDPWESAPSTSQDPERETLTLAGAYPDTDTESDASSIRPTQPYSRPPPALPPRDVQAQPLRQSLTMATAGPDLRANSTESLLPTISASSNKRVLLLIYIHGFMGNETSFASFPAHVHSLLTSRISDTHAVHTKIYPRYKTRNNITVVRNQFSEWLMPHENDDTDVILLGHSMGGIVAAEAALMNDVGRPGEKMHRILGTLNLDVPFLGMHPGIIGAGLASLFGPGADKKGYGESNEAGNNATTASDNVAVLPMPRSDTAESGLDSMSASEPRPGMLSPVSTFSVSSHTGSSRLETPDGDPYYNPSFTNDLPVPVRKPVDSFFHFVDKHLVKAESSRELWKAGGKLITSHLEFGGTMAQYSKLDDRYKQLRALEKDPTRVRFVNYFSTCYGRPKAVKTKTAKGKDKQASSGSATDGAGQPDRIGDDGSMDPEETADTDDDVPGMGSLTLTHTDPIPEPEHEYETTPPVRESIESHQLSSTHGSLDEVSASSDDDFEDAHEAHEPDTRSATDKAAEVQSLQSKIALLPPLPAEPGKPADFNADSYTDKDAQKLAKQQHAREMKAYTQAIKDRNAALKEREKLVAKYEKQIAMLGSKEQQAADREAKKEAEAKKKAAAEAEKAAKKAALDEEKAAKKAALEEEKAAKKAAKDEEAAKKKAEKQLIKDEKAALKQKQKAIKEEKLAQAQAQKGKGRDTGDREEMDGDGLPVKEKERKLKTFCLTPPKATTGQRPDWKPVFVVDTDQVTAHCALFNDYRPHYDGFVEEVVDLITNWVESREGTLALD